MTLQKELLELSKRVDDFFKVNSISNIKNTLELSDDFSLPYVFSCEALHPGTFKGYTITEEEILKARDTIFNSTDGFANNEINKDHKGNRKQDSSVDDLIGKITNQDYDFSKKAYILTGEIYDETIARKVHNRILKYVSLRINPGNIYATGNQQFAENLSFEELSFVRSPGDPNAHVIN